MRDVYDGNDELVLHYRQKLPKRPSYGLLEDYAHLVMPLQYEVLQYFEQIQAASSEHDKRRCLFSLIPHKQGFTCNHVKVCSNGLHGILKRAGCEGIAREGVELRATVDDWWRSLFHIDKFETCSRKFAGEIVTDGVSVSNVLRKPCNKAQQQQLRMSDFEEVWGLDPGRTDLLICTNQQGECKHYSTRQFYSRSHYKRSTKTIQGWKQRDGFVEKFETAIPSKKTSELEALQKHVLYVLPALNKVMQWYMDKPFRKLQMKRYIGAQRTLKEIAHMLTKKAGSKTLIGFGDWSNKDSAGVIKKPAGPVKRLEQVLSRHCKVIPVDEFRTSKLHHECGRPLQHRRGHTHRKQTGEVKRSGSIHSVLFCSNKSCGTTMNRDENAARNILGLLTHQVLALQRPRCFCRCVCLEDEECMQARAVARPFEVCVQPVHSGIIAVGA